MATDRDDHPDDGAAPQALNPVQQQVLGQLGATAAERPRFDASVSRELRAYLDQSVTALLHGPDGLGLDDRQRAQLPLFVSKHALTQVHNCEGLYLADRDSPFEWSVRTATGTVVHRAIELGVAWDPEPAPRQLVDEAIASLTESTDSIGDWLYGLDERHRAELRSAAVELVEAFTEVFPPLKPSWRPVGENRLRAELGDNAVVLSGRVDLTLGRPDGDVAGKVIIDYKTGAARPFHVDDLRFYALLETLARGTPPRLLATLYLDSGTLRTEPVTEDLLGAAVRRTMDGVARIAAVGLAGSEPELTPGYHCRWCPAAPDCATGTGFLADLDDQRYDPDDA